MKDIIDTELATQQPSWDFQSICKWLLIGILGCIAFQSYENFVQIVSSHLLISTEVFGINTSVFISNIIGLVFTLIAFSFIIQRLKKLYETKKLDLIKTIRLLAISYVVCVILQLSFNLFSESIGLMNIDVDMPEMISVSILSSINKGYYLVETVVKYGFIASTLLTRF